MSTTPEPASSKAGAETTDPGAADREPTDRETTDHDAPDREPTDRETTDRETTDREPTDETTQRATPESDEQSDEQRQKTAEEFAAEHDPANHDVSAGEEFRQPGDWTADEGGGPEVWDSEGNLISEGDDAEGDDSTGDDATGSGGAAGRTERRVSRLDEVKDGGYSVGSAATIHDGAMPVGHPVKAWEDTKTYVTEDHEHYDEAEPHVWFTDAETAERAGFRPAD